MNYTPQQLKVIWKALKGFNLLGQLQANTGHSRSSVRNTFLSPEFHHIPMIADEGVRLLKDNGILTDIQTLTEILS